MVCILRATKSKAVVASYIQKFADDFISMGNHKLSVQFGIYLHECLFQLAEIASAASASAILVF